MKKMEFCLLVVSSVIIEIPFTSNQVATVLQFLTFLFSPSKGRTVSEDSSVNFCELLLCGSRGVGGIATMSDEGVICMDLLDLEEDDDEEEDEGSY